MDRSRGLMAKIYDFHCPKCHTWVNAYDMPYETIMACPDCGKVMFWDPDHEGCQGTDDTDCPMNGRYEAS